MTSCGNASYLRAFQPLQCVAPCGLLQLRGSSDSKTALQLFAIASAQSKASLVVKLDLVVAVGAESEAPNAIQIDDRGPVNAAKGGGIEILFEFGNAAAQH